MNFIVTIKIKTPVKEMIRLLTASESFEEAEKLAVDYLASQGKSGEVTSLRKSDIEAQVGAPEEPFYTVKARALMPGDTVLRRTVLVGAGNVGEARNIALRTAFADKGVSYEILSVSKSVINIIK